MPINPDKPPVPTPPPPPPPTRPEEGLIDDEENE